MQFCKKIKEMSILNFYICINVKPLVATRAYLHGDPMLTYMVLKCQSLRELNIYGNEKSVSRNLWLSDQGLDVLTSSIL